MIIFMSDILCVTNRTLCKDDFLSRIEHIAKAAPAGIILREKDLSEAEYQSLAADVMKICETHKIPCILHSFINAAMELNSQAIHLPLPILRTLSPAQKAHFCTIGASCHSVLEALEAEQLGATYLIAGHIFPTDCKRGVPCRGTDFLLEVCKSVSIPVYAIGGIDSANIVSVRSAGAKGGCIMSGFMGCSAPKSYMKQFEKAGERDGI